LGIPTVRNRVVQMAVLLILEPIFEAECLDCSYGFRPGRSAHDALRTVRRNLEEGYCAVYDADLKGYFDSIPHDNLVKCVEKRVKGLVRLLYQRPERGLQQWIVARNPGLCFPKTLTNHARYARRL